MNSDRDNQLYESLVYFADIMIAGFDVIDLADRLVNTCVDLLGADAAGIMLDDQNGHLRVLAASNEETRLLELLELQTDEGPCLQAFATQSTVVVGDIETVREQWPRFVAAATDLGIRSTYALPMRLRDRTIGALNLFTRVPAGLDDADQKLAHVLAGMATIGIINHRTIRQQEVLAEQLQTALNSRVIIEQAKGVIAERFKMSMGSAFELLRAAARASRRPLSEVAADVAEGRWRRSPCAAWWRSRRRTARKTLDVMSIQI